MTTFNFKRFVAIGVLVGIAVVLVLGYIRITYAAPLLIEPVTGCSSPLLVILPDGTNVPATGVVYDIPSRTVTVLGNQPIFCNGFE